MWLWNARDISSSKLATYQLYDLGQITASPRIMWFHSTLFSYKVDKMPRNLYLIYINQPVVKFILSYVISLEVVERFEGIK